MRTGWQRVGQFVRTRRLHLGYRTTQDFADVCHLSYSTINALETGRRGNFDETTIGLVEAALQWEPGSIERTLQGRRPILMHDPDLQQIIDLWPRLHPPVRSALLAAARGAADQTG